VVKFKPDLPCTAIAGKHVPLDVACGRWRIQGTRRYTTNVVGDRDIRNAAGLAHGNRVPALGPSSVVNGSFVRGCQGLQMDLT
jgi:hypothetical protein